ncbi:Imm7 family immunity protein [Kitasatospora sp. NPDC051984]|uniref:Imm7 family immunity protein n=1 Tax=Kitasatospora sp. NPDC051984 TaxID=3364059 RepID=UPI0037C5DD72
MFEYHGWVTIRERADAEDDEDFAAEQARLWRLVEAIEEVHRMVRGQVSVHEDTHLSPCIPVLEDPWVS